MNGGDVLFSFFCLFEENRELTSNILISEVRNKQLLQEKTEKELENNKLQEGLL